MEFFQTNSQLKARKAPVESARFVGLKTKLRGLLLFESDVSAADKDSVGPVPGGGVEDGWNLKELKL